MRTSRASATLDLTKDEQANVRAALQFLRHRVGGWEQLAKVLHLCKRTLAGLGQGRAINPLIAFRVARFVRVPMEELLMGTFLAPGTCPFCGHVKEESDESA
jgi:hypothetical protein